VDTPDRSDGNAIVWTTGGRVVEMMYGTIEGKGWADCGLYRRSSTDRGDTWSGAAPWREQWGWLVRAAPLPVDDGAWLLPAYDERAWEGLVLRSEDGSSWSQPSRLSAASGVIQPALAQLPSGEIVAVLRPGGRGGPVQRAHSLDGGRSWSACEPIDQLNPNSGLDLASLPDGRLLLANNPSRTGRSPLTLSVSEDRGLTWRQVATVRDGEGEWSYPQLRADSHGVVHLVYTARRRAIGYCRLSL
jgi:predicted neuraminidase